jgi:hypothetical protein
MLITKLKGGEKMNYNKKGQAAMEFLMTYGWAILAAVIAIAVLAYFGVFSPSRLVPAACTVNAPLGCDEHKIEDSTGVTFMLRNGAGDTIHVSEVDITECGTETFGTPLDILAGSSAEVEVTCSPALTPDENFKGVVTVTYTVGAGAYDQSVTGSITGKVVDA